MQQIADWLKTLGFSRNTLSALLRMTSILPYCPICQTKT